MREKGISASVQPHHRTEPLSILVAPDGFCLSRPLSAIAGSPPSLPLGFTLTRWIRRVRIASGELAQLLGFGENTVGIGFDRPFDVVELDFFE